MSVQTAGDDLSAAQLADKIDRALVADGLRDEWTFTDVQATLEDEVDLNPAPSAIIAAFGVLDAGGWWYRAEREKLIYTFKEAGPPVGVKPD